MVERITLGRQQNYTIQQDAQFHGGLTKCEKARKREGKKTQVEIRKKRELLLLAATHHLGSSVTCNQALSRVCGEKK